MEFDIFFNCVVAHHKKRHPFVVYRKPHGNTIKGFFQNNIEVYTTKEYTEEGFVFAPFDSSQQTVLFPLGKCDVLECPRVSTPKSTTTNNKAKVVASPIEEQHHIALVKKGVEAIHSGAFQKVVLSRKLSIRKPEAVGSDEIISLFKKLESLYPSAFVYCWFHPKVGLWLGATPERLVSVVGNKIKTMALAGTQKYTEKMKIVWGKKEREEQQLVTDFILSALQPVSSTISVGETVSHRAGQLVHLKNDITAVLSDGNDLKNLIQQLHPTPAVCGLPKEQAKQFILENEHYNRRFYTGFLGESNMINSNDAPRESDFYVNLRCMQIDEQSINIYVGGGITKDSDAEAEWQETVNKAQTMLAVL